jgi:hypothetical protein
LLSLHLSRSAVLFGALAAGCLTAPPAPPGEYSGDDAQTDATTSDDGSHPSTEGGRGPGDDADIGSSVLQHHLHASRDGHYIDPLMTPAYAARLALDTTFDGAIHGPLWAQPLYVENGVGGKGTYYVADDSNDIYAIDETSGLPVWQKTPLLGSAAATGACSSMNPAPIGVTGTPLIDLTRRTMYFSAVKATPDGSVILTHQIHALSIDDGAEQTGWPVDVGTITSASGVMLNPEPQGQRSAVALLNGYLYVAYGGEYEDCGAYHGWVVSVPVVDPEKASAWTTVADKGGIWAAGGISSDGVDVFAGTGNAAAGTTHGLPWPMAGSEAVLRFHDGSSFDMTNTRNYFSPSNWQTLDDDDTDLCGTGPLVVDVPGATPSALIVQLGKSGVMHILDRTNLGGVGTGNGTTGEGLYSNRVAYGAIRTSPATYTTSGATYVVFNGNGNGSGCPEGQNGDLIAVQITPTSPPTFRTVWCAESGGAIPGGAPIVTTTDAAGANPIVWVVGAEASNQLTGWDGVTGAQIFDGGGVTMDTVRRYSTLIDVKGRLIVGATDKLYAFKSTK